MLTEDIGSAIGPEDVENSKPQTPQNAACIGSVVLQRGHCFVNPLTDIEHIPPGVFLEAKTPLFSNKRSLVNSAFALLARRDASDLSRIDFHKPEVPIWAFGDGRWSAISGREWKLRHLPIRGHPPNQVALLLCKPEVAIPPDGNASREVLIRGQGKGGNLPLRGDATNVPLGEPEVAIRPGNDPLRRVACV